MVAEGARYDAILVTGGAGFVGANYVRHLLAARPSRRVVVYDKLTYAGNLDNLLGLAEQHGDRYAFVQGDVCDAGHVRRVVGQHGIDAIVNFAAESHVDRSLVEPRTFLDTNVDGTWVLLEAARQFGLRMHHVSTDEVYGQVMHGSASEDDRLDPRSPYSASKAAADLLCLAYRASFGVRVTITRGSNSIGPYQYPEKIVPLFITRALDGLPLPVFGDGLAVRDYLHVEDHCRAIDLVLHEGIAGETYNVGGGNEVTCGDVARMILDALGRPRSLATSVADRPGHDRRYSLDCARAWALGWRPRLDFDRALQATIDWYVGNEWWWRGIQARERRGGRDDGSDGGAGEEPAQRSPQPGGG